MRREVVGRASARRLRVSRASAIEPAERDVLDLDVLVDPVHRSLAAETRLLDAAEWDFDGPEIFKRAVNGMVQASHAVMAKCGVKPEDIDLVVPHQANMRIIEAVVTRSGVPMDKVMLTVERYGNMSAATVPVASASE